MTNLAYDSRMQFGGCTNARFSSQSTERLKKRLFRMIEKISVCVCAAEGTGGGSKQQGQGRYEIDTSTIDAGLMFFFQMIRRTYIVLSCVSRYHLNGIANCIFFSLF